MKRQPDRSCILTVNGGSSSLKFGMFAGRSQARSIDRLGSGRIERIGLPDAQAKVSGALGEDGETWPVNAPDFGAAAEVLIDWLEKHIGCAAIAGVGHRIVHGGPRYHAPALITQEVIAELRRICPLDVDHLPAEIDLIERFERLLPDVPHVACFDTAFHHAMPRVAQMVGIPRRFENAGVRRYGFHGLSYEYLMAELERAEGADAAAGRVILAHLGAGASMAAVHKKKCVETTMGLTPASGLLMATRCGDIDPGLPFFLAQSTGITTDRFHHLVNHESGMLGVSDSSADLRDLLARSEHDIRAAEAVDLFFYHAKKAIGALSAALGGLDILVFSGGIGENSALARARICEGLGFLGLSLDQYHNQAGRDTINDDSARVKVRVMRTDEEVVIASGVVQRLAMAERRTGRDE